MAQDTTAKKANFISRAVAACVALADARDTLLQIRSEYDAIGYGSILADADFTGSNSHLTAAILTSGMTSQGNLETFWGAGNGTNIEKIRP